MFSFRNSGLSLQTGLGTSRRCMPRTLSRPRAARRRYGRRAAPAALEPVDQASRSAFHQLAEVVLRAGGFTLYTTSSTDIISTAYTQRRQGRRLSAARKASFILVPDLQQPHLEVAGCGAAPASRRLATNIDRPRGCDTCRLTRGHRPRRHMFAQSPSHTNSEPVFVPLAAEHYVSTAPNRAHLAVGHYSPGTPLKPKGMTDPPARPQSGTHDAGGHPA